MQPQPGKLSRFWQELKRRKVHRLMAIYAGSAYVIFEASTLIFPRWGFPDWTIDLVLYLLILGAIITFVVSWIYDVTPGGIQKTKRISEAQEREVPTTTNGWKIASYISLVVILVLIVLNILPRTGEKEILAKSIAVLPFRNDSPSDENEHFIQGYRTSVHDNLCRIKELKVISLLSTELYRSNPKPIPEIARELDVSYLLEARGQMYDKKIRLIVQLIDADENIIWSHPFDKQINEVDDHISIQSEIAQSVASEIEAIISPEEKQLIGKRPTTSLTAYDQYLKAREEYLKFWLNPDDTDALDRAESLYSKALQYDSAFSQAYAGLAWTLFSRNFAIGPVGTYYSIDYFDDERVDSVEILTEWALRFDDQNVDGLTLRGVQYLGRGKIDEALTLTERALEINPNHSMGFIVNSYVGWLANDYIFSINSLQQALKIERGIYLPWIFHNLYTSFLNMGLPDESESSLNELIAITGDSVVYYSGMSQLELLRGNPQKVEEYITSAYELDYQRTQGIISMGDHYYYIQKYREAYPYYAKHIDRMKEAGLLSVNLMHRMAHVLWELDRMEEAMDSFNQFIEVAGQCISRKNVYGTTGAHYDLAGVYAFLGDREEAYSHLEAYAAHNFQVAPMVKMLKKRDPLFEKIRHEERFQQIVKDVEAKYQAEHERVREWLVENDML